MAWLRERSLVGADPVGLVARTDVSSLVMLHALIATGTPVLLLHPRHTGTERKSLLERVGASWPGRSGAPVVVPGDWRAAVRTSGPGRPDLDAPDPGAPLAVLFTSGTTGRPRGVVLSRRSFIASAAASAANLGWEADDRWLLPLPVAHVGGLSIVTRCLLARSTVVLAGSTDPGELLAAIRRHRATLVSVVPTLLARLLDLEPPVEPPPGLRAVLVGGGATGPALLGRAADRGWPVLTTYGLTEACSQVTTQPYGTVNRGDLGAGPPLPGFDLRIAGRDEIQVRGPALFDGYLVGTEAGEAPARPDDNASPTGEPSGSGRPALDRPFLEGGWFPTGDHGRLDDRGHLHVFGRRVDRIVTGGENVDPVEVEKALEALDRVKEACVVGLPDPEWGEVVCAAIVVESSDSDTPFDPAGATHALRDTLAPFKLPRRLTVFDALPRNALGKLDRPEVRRLLAASG